MLRVGLQTWENFSDEEHRPANKSSEDNLDQIPFRLKAQSLHLDPADRPPAMRSESNGDGVSK